MIKREPLLNRAFKFYNAYVWLDLKEKEKIGGMQVIEDFCELLVEKDEENRLKELEV